MAGINVEQRTRDANLSLKAAGLIAASAAVATIVDLGSAGFVEGDIIIDVSAIEVATGNEFYKIVLQGTVSDATFGTATNIVELAQLSLGDSSIRETDADAADDTTGRYVLPFRNERNGVQYRYLRLYTVCAGTIATGINYTATLTKQRGLG